MRAGLKLSKRNQSNNWRGLDRLQNTQTGSFNSQIHQVITHENRLLHWFQKYPALSRNVASLQLLFPWIPSETREWARKEIWPLTGSLNEIVVGKMEMEEWDGKPLKGPEGTMIVRTVRGLKGGNWLVVTYDDHWWQTTTNLEMFKFSLAKRKEVHF